MEARELPWRPRHPLKPGTLTAPFSAAALPGLAGRFLAGHPRMTTAALSFWPVTLVDYAQVVGAAATVVAVVVSLWLAQRRPQPRLLAYMSCKEGAANEGFTVPCVFYNAGDAATSIHEFVPAILRVRVPTWMVPRLRWLGRLLLKKTPPGGRLRLHGGTMIGKLEPHTESEVPLALYADHRSALSNGRLILAVLHTPSRHRHDWIPVRSMARR